MVFEHAILSIHPGREAQFESVFTDAPAIFARADGCHGIELRRCIEVPSQYEAIVGWDDVETHDRFRGSPLFSEWRGLVGQCFAAPPAVQHYRIV
jgi:heme-degrading monooxygenase HmoA